MEGVTMRISRTWGRVAGGAAVAAACVLLLPDGPLAAKAGRQNRGGPLKLTDIDIGDFAGVPQNHIIDMRFTQPIDPATVNPATFQVRVQNATSTGFTIQVAGSFQVTGSAVRFYPRLPTHLRDPNDVNGGFYQPGTPRDDAVANAGFQPSKNHQITIIGNPSVAAVRSLRGRPLNRSYQARFTTSPETPKDEAFTIDTYQDAPPPGFEFSNPPDKVASAADHYARHGGTEGVPSAIGVTLYGNKVPISPATLRQTGNVTLTMLSRRDDTSLRKPMQGTPYVEQNFDTVKVIFQPRFPLPDLASYALKVTKNVRDLTETYDFKNNTERLRLRSIYEFMVAARQLNPTTPAADLGDPPPDLIYDWPADTATRGILKANVLDLGDRFPDEVDPRVMVLFTTQDEPVSHGQVIVNFVQAEGYYDPQRSTAEWDQSNPGVANGVFTFAGGSGVNGNFLPSTNTSLSADSFPQNTVNWRSVSIPPNVTVTVTGTRPFLVKALSFQLDGKLVADGAAGTDASTSAPYSGLFTSQANTTGGKGGPGGGRGGNGSTVLGATGQPAVPGETGVAGNDSNGTIANAQDGGRGGLGGTQATASAYSMGGGGGGGGARTAGSAGAAGTAYYPSWSGNGGLGGAGALGNDDVTPLTGGAGGGGGGNGGYMYPSYLWGQPGGAGGGGGGAVMIQTSGTLTVGTSGTVRARGGKGGQGSGIKSTWSAGPGGGGGGGTILLRSSKGFNIANPAASLDVSGGGPGTQTGTYTAPYGGTGGTGFIRLEDPNGGIAVPGGTAGSFSPVGAGVPSYVYSKWIDLGVDGPRITNFKASDFSLNAGNDAILIEIQAAIESPTQFGVPLTTAIDANENSTNVNQVSSWTPVRLVDGTTAGGAFNVPGNTSKDAIFPIESVMAGKNYKFMRLRATFQLDPSQTATSPLPFVDQLVFHFDFNF
jgi:hypothetical protein